MEFDFGPKCDPWCTPLIIYVVCSAIGLFFTLFFSGGTFAQRLLNTLVSLLWVMFIGYILYILCQNCQSNWAWFILLFPIVLYLIIAVIFEIDYKIYMS